MSYRRKRKKSSDEISSRATDEPKIVYNQFTSRFETVGRRRRSQTQVKRTPSPLSPAYASSGQTSVERADKELKQISRPSNLQQARNREDVIESVLNDIRIENTTRELSEVNEQLNEINVRLDTKSAERRRKNIVDKKPSVVTEATMRQDVEYAALADDKDALKQKKSELGQQLQFYQTKSRRSEESLTSGFDKDIQGIQNYPVMDIDIQRDPITNKAMSPGERVDFNPILQGTVADPDLSISDIKMKKGKARTTPWYYMRRKFEAGSEKQPGIGKDAPSFGSFPGIQYAYGDDGSTIGVAPTTPKVEAKGDGLTRIGVLGGVIEEDGDDYKTKGDMLQQFASGGVGVFENVGYILEDVQKHGLDVDKYGPVKETAFDLVIDMYLKPFDSKEYEAYSAERQTGDWWSDNVGTAMEFMGTSQYRQLHQKQQENTISELKAYPAYYAGSMAVEIATFFVPVKAATYIKPALKLGIAATKKAGYSPRLTKTPVTEGVISPGGKTREIPGYQRKAKVKDTTGMDVDPDVAGFTRKERIAQRLGEYFEKRSDPEAWFLLTQAKKKGAIATVRRPVKRIISEIEGGRRQEATTVELFEKTKNIPSKGSDTFSLAPYKSKQTPLQQADEYMLTSKGEKVTRDVKEELFWTVERSKTEDTFMIRGFQYAEEGGRIVARDKGVVKDAIWVERAIPKRTFRKKQFLRGKKKLSAEVEKQIESGYWAEGVHHITTSPRFSRKTKDIDFDFDFESGGGSALEKGKGTMLYDTAKSILQYFGVKKIPENIKAEQSVLLGTKSGSTTAMLAMGLKPASAEITSRAGKEAPRFTTMKVEVLEGVDKGKLVDRVMVEADVWEIVPTTGTRKLLGFKNKEELGNYLRTGSELSTWQPKDDAVKVADEFLDAYTTKSVTDNIIGAKYMLGQEDKVVRDVTKKVKKFTDSTDKQVGKIGDDSVTIEYNVPPKKQTAPFNPKTGQREWKSFEDPADTDINPDASRAFTWETVKTGKKEIDYDEALGPLFRQTEGIKPTDDSHVTSFNILKKLVSTDKDGKITGVTELYKKQLTNYVEKIRSVKSGVVPSGRKFEKVKQKGKTEKPYEGKDPRQYNPDDEGGFGSSSMENVTGYRTQTTYTDPKKATITEELEFLQYMQRSMDKRLYPFAESGRTPRYKVTDPGMGDFGEDFRIVGFKKSTEYDSNLLFDMLSIMKKSSKSADDLADLDKLKFSIIRKKTDLSKSAILRDRDTYVPELHRRADEAKASLREKEQSLLRSQKAEETINKRLARLKRLEGTIRRDAGLGFAPETKIDPKTGKMVKTGRTVQEAGSGQNYFPEYEYAKLPETSAIRRIFEGKLNLAQMTRKDRREVLRYLEDETSTKADLLGDEDYIRFFGRVVRHRTQIEMRKGGFVWDKYTKKWVDVGGKTKGGSWYNKFRKDYDFGANPYDESDVRTLFGRGKDTLTDQADMAPVGETGARRFDKWVADAYPEPVDFMSAVKRSDAENVKEAYRYAGTNISEAKKPIQKKDITDTQERLEDELFEAREKYIDIVSSGPRPPKGDFKGDTSETWKIRHDNAYNQVRLARQRLEAYDGVREPSNQPGKKQILEGTGGRQTTQGPEQTLDDEFERITNEIILLERQKLYHKGNRTIAGQEKGVAKARHTVIDIESQLLNIGSNVADMKTAYVGRQLSVKTGSNFGTSARGMAKIQKSVESPREFHSNISDIDWYMDADLPGRNRLAVITDSGTKIVSAGRLETGEQFRIVTKTRLSKAQKAVRDAQKSVDELTEVSKKGGMFTSKTGKQVKFFKGIGSFKEKTGERGKRLEKLEKAQAMLTATESKSSFSLPEISLGSALRTALFGSKDERTSFRSALRALRIKREGSPLKRQSYFLSMSDTRKVINQAREFVSEGVEKTPKETLSKTKPQRKTFTDADGEKYKESDALSQYSDDLDDWKIDTTPKRTKQVLEEQEQVPGFADPNYKTPMPKTPAPDDAKGSQALKQVKKPEDKKKKDYETRPLSEARTPEASVEFETQRFPQSSPQWSGGIGMVGSGIIGGKFIPQAWGSTSIGSGVSIPVPDSGNIIPSTPTASLPSIQRSIELPSVTVGTGIESASKLSPNVVTAARTLIRQTVTPIPQQAIKPVQDVMYKQALMPTVPLTTTIPAVAPRPIPPPPPTPPMMPVFWELPDADPRKRKKIKPKKQKKKKIYWFAPADPFTPFDPKEYKVFTGRESKFIKRVEKRRFGDDSVNTLG